MKKWFVGLNEKKRKIIAYIFLIITIISGYWGLHSNFWSYVWLVATILTVIIFIWNHKAKPKKRFDFDIDKWIEIQEEKLDAQDKYAPLQIVESNEKDVEYAYKLINLAAQKYDEGNVFGYVCVLNGIGISRVGSNLDMPHNHRAVVDAIHLYQKDNPEKFVIEAYAEAICTTIKAIGGPQAVDKIIDVLNYELTLQESGKAALSIDFNTIVQKLNELEEENETKHIYDEPRQKLIFDFKKRVEKKYDC